MLRGRKKERENDTSLLHSWGEISLSLSLSSFLSDGGGSTLKKGKREGRGRGRLGKRSREWDSGGVSQNRTNWQIRKKILALNVETFVV